MRWNLERHKTTTNLLILVMISSFVLELFWDGYLESFYFSYDHMLSQPYRFFTSSFLHLNWSHILLNAFCLYIFGNFLEKEAGAKQFLLVFFLGSLAGILGYILVGLLGLERLSDLIGASDSIYAILGAGFFLGPRKTLEFFFIKMQVRTALAILLMYDLLGTLGIFALHSNVAHSAHFSALIFGYFYARFVIVR